MWKQIITYLFIFSFATVLAQQKDSIRFTLGFNGGYLGARIFEKPKLDPDYTWSIPLSQRLLNLNFNLKLGYGKNNLDIGATTGERMIFTDYAHSFANYGLTALMLNYQHRIFEHKIISVYGSYFFLYRFLNNYKADARDGLDRFTVNYFSIEQFIGYAIKARLYRQLYLEQKGGYGFGFGKNKWDYKKPLAPNYQDSGEVKFGGQAILLSVGIGYDFSRKNKQQETK